MILKYNYNNIHLTYIIIKKKKNQNCKTLSAKKFK